MLKCGVRLQEFCTADGSNGLRYGSEKGYTWDVNASTLAPGSATPSVTSSPTKRVLLLKPRGFCAGVVRAVDIVKIALETFGAPIYVRKEIVHNS
jgi:4-hydroxy-3-methylbut-2-en-1-yl diphosphate reductase